MSVNASSTTSLLLEHCWNINFAVTAIRVILLLPLSIIILYLGLQQWRQQHSFKTASHSDLFAYHLAAMELIWVIGCFCFLCLRFVNSAVLIIAGERLALAAFYGELLFHILAFVERYLAVVHPIIYMGLKNTRGIRVRNISIGCVWVLSFVLMFIHVISKSMALFCLLAVSLIVTCYCSIFVLCVLIRPRPGDGGREKERVDQSKQRALHTITAISAVLWFWFVGLLVAFALYGSKSLDPGVSCLVLQTTKFLHFPSCLVSPLLYLHRTEKLTFSCCSRE